MLTALAVEGAAVEGAALEDGALDATAAPTTCELELPQPAVNAVNAASPAAGRRKRRNEVIGAPA
ncbi:MAG TPA: hypothetical protein VH594_01780 [Trebonia sp.]